MSAIAPVQCSMSQCLISEILSDNVGGSFVITVMSSNFSETISQLVSSWPVTSCHNCTTLLLNITFYGNNLWSLAVEIVAQQNLFWDIFEQMKVIVKVFCKFCPSLW